MMATAEPVEVLLVDDNEADRRLTLEALRDAKVRNTLHEARDGVEALEFLRRQGDFADAPRPDLVLLDLHMPRMSGDEVLQEIKQDADLRRIPVVVLTSSRAEEDILRSYDYHANCYISKPVSLDRFMEVVRSIESFWISVVRLPR